MTDKPTSRVVGYGACVVCGLDPRPVKADRKGHLYIYCAVPADGDCGGGVRSTHDAADWRIDKRGE